MKQKGFYALCVLTGLFITFAAPALANSWGLQGPLLALFENDRAYDDYSFFAGDAETAAHAPEGFAAFIMQSPAHQRLFVAMERETGWELVATSTAVLYPLEDERAASCRIEKAGPGAFALIYPGERYVFAYQNGQWLWVGAEFEEVGTTITYGDEEHYTLFAQGLGETGLYIRGVPLDQLDIRTIPRTAEEIRAEYPIRALLRTGLAWDFGSGGEMSYLPGGGNVPVYAAPDENAYRGAGGRASVSLPGGFYPLGWEGNFLLVRYDIAEGRQRWGYIKEDLPDIQSSGLSIIRYPATIRVDTPITDDPLVSQAPLAILPSGQDTVLLSYIHPFLAYVETAIEGKAARGFVPISALQIAIEEGGWNPEELVGRWYNWGGGTMFAMDFELFPDGRAITYDEIDGVVTNRHATWHITDYDPQYGFFWNEPPYMITFRQESGLTHVYGLEFSEEGGFSLTYWEGGGGYLPYGMDPPY